jgi:tetratricopeptide (TPR) repeat protein
MEPSDVLGANRGEYGEAEKAYGKTFEVDPGFALAHVELHLMALSTSAGAEQAAAHLRAALAYAERLPQKFQRLVLLAKAFSEFEAWRTALGFVRPETVVRWHREGFEYYNKARPHLSLDKDSPQGRQVMRPERGAEIIPIDVSGPLRRALTGTCLADGASTRALKDPLGKNEVSRDRSALQWPRFPELVGKFRGANREVGRSALREPTNPSPAIRGLAPRVARNYSTSSTQERALSVRCR